ncbi:MAG: Undecaprenyl-phosphate 4-deoxy-4-formamido-L-arabinose transferase [candidate division BRC1 bacterium ADurb.BinA292]|nr:MAG: Undecaprenyl-phosphate 4-deoxy-4-formamido-L-arabinose transferase [candidate division BRC1 bacterium ADurb.BinA292]
MNDTAGETLDLSFVIPLKNEAESLNELYQRLVDVIERLAVRFELIFVDDGSTDDSLALLQALRGEDARVKIIQFQGNFGKAAALAAGFEHAAGRIVFTMDADLQDDPAEIPAFLKKLDEGYDLVSGWKRIRQDPLSKTLPSRLFNAVTARLTGVRLHDFNCGFKAYRREVLANTPIYGELHRYVPVLAAAKGFKVGEVVVRHHPRLHGRSKYGIERLTRGLFDLLTVLFLTRYLKRPLHFFGGIGLAVGGIGFLCLLYLTIIWMFGAPIGHRPLLLFGVLLVVFGMQLVSVGLVTEMLARLTSHADKGYVIRRYYF